MQSSFFSFYTNKSENTAAINSLPTRVKHCIPKQTFDKHFIYEIRQLFRDKAPRGLQVSSLWSFRNNSARGNPGGRNLQRMQGGGSALIKRSIKL